MNLFLYYAGHTLKNQILKLFKSWVIVFILICGLVGGGIGFGVAMLEDAAEETATESVLEEYEDYEEYEDMEDLQLLPEGAEDLLTMEKVLELMAGAAVALVLFFVVFNADKSGAKLFLPADAALLFASPMKPQSVLAFRMATKLGLLLVFLLYLPNFILNFELSAGMALMLILALTLCAATGLLLQVWIYMLCSTHPAVKKNFHRVLYLILLAVAASFYIYWQQSGTESAFLAAGAFFTAPASRLVPVWGWLKGVFICAYLGQTMEALLCVAGSLAVVLLLILAVSRTKADFYEDAMAKSEETQALLDAANAEKSVGFRKRKKDRSDKLRRDGFRYGSGASVFLFRPLYNRFRFAHFGIFTKTMETYLAAAVAVAAAGRLILDSKETYLLGFVFGILVFYRALGNPVEEDTSKDLFLLVPDSAWSKLLYSLLGGIVNCLLDLLPAILLGAVLLGASPLKALLWIPFLLTLDYFSGTVGAFMGLSIPASIGATAKQLLQILFIYFGLLPDIVILAFAMVHDQMLLGVVAAGTLNILLGSIFLALSTRYIDPVPKPHWPVVQRTEEEMNQARSVFSRIGLGCFVLIVSASLLQIFLPRAVYAVFPAAAESVWATWMLALLPIYLVGFPLALLIFRKLPRSTGAEEGMSVVQFLKMAAISFFVMVAGNLLGTGINLLLLRLTGSNSQATGVNTLLAEDSVALRLLFVVIIGPVIEEIIFRRQLIDRLRPYGEKLAVITSAIVFGLFHGNLQQFFYATALGLVFGYVYLKTNRLRYSIGLHMLVNLNGSIISVEFMKAALQGAEDSLESMAQGAEGALTPGMIGFLVYIVLFYVIILLGLILLLYRAPYISYNQAELELPKGKGLKTAFGNAGMLLLVLVCLVLFALSYLSVGV